MRLVTRGDLDGLACAVLLGERERISEIVLAHPQDLTDGRLEITGRDLIANLPFDPRCGMWFDHRPQIEGRAEPPEGFPGSWDVAPSAARVIWEHYGADPRWRLLVEETDRVDSGRLTEQDVIDPQGYVLLGFTLDGRSGLGAFELYFRRCLDYVRHQPIDRVLRQPLVSGRTRSLRHEEARFRQALQRCSRQLDNVVVTDFRHEPVVPIGNRFLVYVLFPEANVSVRLHWGPGMEFVVVAVAHSIFDRSCPIHIGELMAWYGGGGHRGAGSVPLPVRAAEKKIDEILAVLREG